MFVRLFPGNSSSSVSPTLISAFIQCEFYSWSEWLVSCIPGLIGQKIRVAFYKIFLRRSLLKSVGYGSTLTSPNSISIGTAALGKYNELIACPNSSISIGNNTHLNSRVYINSSVGGRISIGDNCLIGPNFVARTASHAFRDRSKPVLSQGHNCLDIIIHNDVWIAANVTVIGGVTLSEGCIVGAGAVVTKSLPPYSIAYGLPARVVSYRK
jgi:acetyltransferase-like isoleucine patch superfamily enzyme